MLSCIGNTLIVAPWGLPPQWRDVKYVLEVDDKRIGGSVKYCTTLIPLILSMENQIKEGKVDIVIIVLDSLVDKYTRSGSSDSSTCYSCYSELSSYIDEANRVSSYKELTLKLNEFIREFIKCLFKKHRLDISINLNVIVAPAIGSPGGKWVFRGDLQDYESVVLYELGKLCLEKPYSKIVIDLSHGINFMPSLIMRIVHKLASIQLLAHKELSSVAVEVFNSDPIPPPASPERDIRINRAVYENIKSILLIHTIPKLIDFSSVARSDKLLMDKFLSVKEELTDEVNKVLGSIRNIYSSLYYPLPLALHHFLCRDLCKSIEGLDNILGRFLDYVVIERSDPNNPTVTRPITMNPDALYIYYVVRALCKRVSIHGSEEPTIDYLDSEIKPIYKYVHESLHILIEHELSKLKELYRDLRSSQDYQSLRNTWRTLHEIKLLVSKSSTKEGKERKPDKRILIAHAGLQEELTQILIDDKPKLRYVLNPEEILRDSGLLVK